MLISFNLLVEGETLTETWSYALKSYQPANGVWSVEIISIQSEMFCDIMITRA